MYSDLIIEESGQIVHYIADNNKYFQMRFNVTTEDVGEYLCHVQSNSDEGEAQSMINVKDGEYQICF